MKKYILKLGGLGVIAIPLVTVISCGENSSSNEKSNNNSYIKDGIIVSSSPKKITKKESIANFANPISTLADINNKSELQERLASGQPFGLHYHARDLANWESNKDVDRYYNKATIPLRNRELAAKYISTQKPKDLDILATLNAQTSRNKIGTVAKNYQKNRVFTMWSHISKMVNWGGSSSEGNWLIPKGDDINVAHRNGVPIMGTLFMAPNQFGGSVTQYEDMVVEKDGIFPVADSMVKLAEFYGFDGWFLNLETTGVTDELSAKIGSFIKYLYEKMTKKKQFLILYDYGEGNKYYANGYFDLAAIDFHNRDQTYNLPQEKRSYGYNYDRGLLSGSDEGGKLVYDKNNLWIYTYFRVHDPVLNGDEADLKFFSDSQGSRDPRKQGTDAWIEMSKYFQDKTVINGRKVFSTSFEQGFGNKFYINGVEAKLGNQLLNDGYRNAGLQDVLPTYTWINDYYDENDELVSQPGNKITIDGEDWISKIVDNEPTYYGSSSLKYTGKIESHHSIISKLYGTNLTLKENDEFSIIVKGSSIEPSLVIWTQDTDENDLTFDKSIINHTTKKDLGNNFFNITYKIPTKLSNKEMKQFGIQFNNNESNIKEINCQISKITFIPIEQLKTQSTKNNITKIRHDGDFIFSSKRNVRINWDMTNNQEVDHYRIYTTKDDFIKKSLLTITSLPAAHLRDVPISSGVQLKLIIEAINEKNEIISSNKVKIRTNFIQMNDKSKWKIAWKRVNDDSSKYIFQSNNGYTAKFKDDNEEIYFGDDYTRVHKLSKDGQFLSNGSHKWGEKLLGADSRDVHIRKILNWDDTHIAVITKKGTLHILDKKLGEVVNDDINIIKNFLSNINPENPVESSSLSIENVLFASSKNGKTKLLLEVKDSANKVNTVFLTVNHNNYEIKKLDVKENITIDKISTTLNGDYLIAYKVKDKNGKETINIIKQSNQLDLSSLTSDSNISQKLNEFIASDNFKNALSSNGKTEVDQTDFLALGNIIDLREVDDKIMALNSWGLAFTLNTKGKLEKVSSIVDANSWGVISDCFKNYDTSSDAVLKRAFPQGIDNKLSTFYSVWKNILNRYQQIPMSLLGPVLYDETNKKYVLSQIIGFTNAWWGHWNLQYKIVMSDISTLLNGTSSELINKAGSVTLSSDDDKKIGSIIFIDSTNEIYIIGGGGKVALFNKEFEQIPFGNKIYSYDGKVILNESRVFDDGVRIVPKELLQ